jgi:hypothetical protein
VLADRQSLKALGREDWFLRRVAYARYIKRGLVSAKAFECRPGEVSLSYTFQDVELRTGQGLDAYHVHSAFPSGDLPGICTISFVDLVDRTKPPLPPRFDPDPDDARYGHLHCSTDCPDRDNMERLAKLATENGVVRPFVPAADRSL